MLAEIMESAKQSSECSQLSTSQNYKESLHLNVKNAIKERILDALRSKDKNGGVSCSAETLIIAAEKILDFFPNYDFRAVVDSLYKQVCAKKKVALRSKSNRCQPIYPTIHLQRSQNDINEFSYLQFQELPAMPRQNPPKYGANGSRYYDMIIPLEEYSSQLQTMRWHQQRILADVFCSKGYGMNYFRQTINDHDYFLSKDRYKTAMGTMIRLAFRNIEQFVRVKLKRDVSALRKIDVKDLLAILLNIQSYFSKEHSETFYRCLRVSYGLETEPVIDKEVLQFYRKVVCQTRGEQCAKIVDKQVSAQELERINSKVFEEQLWTPAMQLDFACIYLMKRSFSGIKEELQRKYPHIPVQYFDYCRIRARSDRLFSLALRKVIKMLEEKGQNRYLFALSDRLKKIVSRSPIAANIRVDLCNILLNDDISVQYTREVAEKVFKMANENNKRYTGQQIKTGIQENVKLEQSDSFEDENMDKRTNKAKSISKHQTKPQLKAKETPQVKPQKPKAPKSIQVKLQQQIFDSESESQGEACQPQAHQFLQLQRMIKKQVSSIKRLKAR